MKENTYTTYSCEICGATYQVKEVAEECEKSKIPENMDKFVGKWIVVPVNVLDDVSPGVLSSQKLWRLARIDGNKIVSSIPEQVKTQMLRILKVGHTVKYKYRTFEDRTTIRDNDISQCIVVQEQYNDYLTRELLDLEKTRHDPNFPTRQRDKSAELLDDIVAKQELELKEIDDSYFIEGLVSEPVSSE